MDSQNSIQKGVVGETLKLQAVENLFSHDINPGLIDAKIEKKTAAAIKKGNFNPLYLLYFGGLILAAVVAYTMLSQHNQAGEWMTKATTCQSQLAQCKQPVITGQTSIENQQGLSPGIEIT